MSLSHKKLMEILKKQTKDIEVRCDGYRKELMNTIEEIILLENMRRVRGSDIKQKVQKECASLGRFLERGEG